MTDMLSLFIPFVTRIVRRFIEEDFAQISASLAFTTLLSIVPLVAVVFAIMSVMPAFLGMVGQFDQFLVHNFLPERSAGMIVQYVLEFSHNAGNVTVVGLLFLVATVYALLRTIERAFNHVWGVSQNRRWWRRLRVYGAVLALWPIAVAGVIAAVSIAVTTSLGLIDEPPWLRGLLLRLTGVAVTALFFAGLYVAVPNKRVKLRDGLWAGLFAALGFLVMQKGFGLYLSNFPSYTLIYGAFATIPIFLVWLYLSWAVILVGALIAATLHEFHKSE